MANYKINGYDLLSAFGIIPDSDKTTSDSFDHPGDVQDPYSHDWGDGVIEYDLTSAVILKPKEFIIKGTLKAADFLEYQASKLAIEAVIYQQYVTLEHVELGVKFNARLKSGGASWHRLTNFTDDKIAVSVQFQFNEIKQNVPFINNGVNTISFLASADGSLYATQNNTLITSS